MTTKNKVLILMTIICTTLFLILFNPTISAQVKGLKNYCCSKCGTHIESVNQPFMGNCKEGGGHSWKCLGEVGEKNYQCSKCGLVVKSKDTPYNASCKNGGGHNWKRLS